MHTAELTTRWTQKAVNASDRLIHAGVGDEVSTAVWRPMMSAGGRTMHATTAAQSREPMMRSSIDFTPFVSLGQCGAAA